MKPAGDLLDAVQNNGHAMDQSAMLQIMLANQNLKEKSPVINDLISELESLLNDQ